MTIQLNGTIINLVLLVLVLGLGAYMLVLRIDTVQLQKVSNWCLSRKAQLEAGRAAFAKTQDKLSGRKRPSITEAGAELPKPQSVFGRVAARWKQTEEIAERETA